MRICTHDKLLVTALILQSKCVWNAAYTWMCTNGVVWDSANSQTCPFHQLTNLKLLLKLGLDWPFHHTYSMPHLRTGRQSILRYASTYSCNYAGADSVATKPLMLSPSCWQYASNLLTAAAFPRVTSNSRSCKTKANNQIRLKEVTR